MSVPEAVTAVPDVHSREFGGAALTRAALAGQVPAGWYAEVPHDPDGWRDAACATGTSFAGGAWLAVLREALDAQGAAADRLARVAASNGVVVTTGQQPGLFGGPIYTWSKAFSALALADEIERQTGIPTAPVFWAATDDADYTEASYTVVTHNGEVRELRLPGTGTGAPMSAVPLGDVSAEFLALASASGSVIDPMPLDAARAAYVPSQTIGGAYVLLLRKMLESLGIAVLDAAHPAVRHAAAEPMRRALQRAAAVRDALAERSQAIEQAGYKVQVQPVPNLSLVFDGATGERVRVPVKSAASVAETALATDMSPNVLLRPVIERYILPTVAYVAGPAEYAYFAQVSAVAGALGVATPRVVPRWSGVIVEPHVRDILRAIGTTVDDFRDPHAVEGRIAREEFPLAVRHALQGFRTSLRTHLDVFRNDHETPPVLRNAVGGFESQVEYRIARLERRYAAAVKRSGNARLRDVAVARASLFPNGVSQERVLNMLPFLARYGTVVRDRMIEQAGAHARALVHRG